jgi:hypothetical protein
MLRSCTPQQGHEAGLMVLLLNDYLGFWFRFEMVKFVVLFLEINT